MCSKRILVIGASGYLGKRIYQSQLARGHEVIGTGYRHCPPGLRFLDLARDDLEAQLASFPTPEVVFYSAGMTDVDRCEVDLSAAFKVNAHAVGRVTRVFSKAMLIYFSSDYVFDGEHPPYSEDCGTRPINIYGVTKLTGEIYCLQGGRNVVIRVSGLYGSCRENSGLDENLICRVGEIDRFSRPIHINDVVAAANIIVDEGGAGIYHAAGQKTLSRYQFKKMESCYSSSQVEISPIRSCEHQYMARRPKDTSLLCERLVFKNWAPLQTIKDQEDLSSVFTNG